MVQLDVGGLPEDEAIELVRLRAGGTPSLAFVQALYRETEGNPFFIEEIVRHLADAGVRSQDAGARDLERVGLPEDVRDVIGRRLERLDPGSIEWLRVAAVIGRDFDSALLERVLGFDEDRFLAALEDALDAGLVVEAPGDPGRYSFAHALIRETLYEGMSSARRARVHRRVGVALESGPTPPDESLIGALALHFTRAADPEDAERAIRYGLRAGEQATADARQRGGRRPLRAGCWRCWIGLTPRRCAALRSAAGAGRGPGAQRRASAGLGDVPRGGGPGRRAGGQGVAGAGGDRGLPALRAAAGRRRRGAHRAARAGRRDDRRRAHRHAGAAAGAPVRRAVLLRPPRPDGGAERRGDRDRGRARRSPGDGSGRRRAPACLLGPWEPRGAAWPTRRCCCAPRAKPPTSSSPSRATRGWWSTCWSAATGPGWRCRSTPSPPAPSSCASPCTCGTPRCGRR